MFLCVEWQESDQAICAKPGEASMLTLKKSGLGGIAGAPASERRLRPELLAMSVLLGEL
jgi:hypothetical protein